MLYFDYASNMDEGELKGFVSNQGGDPRGISNPRYALLRDWRLVFNFLSPRREAGPGNIEPASGEQVEGVLWDVTDSRVSLLREIRMLGLTRQGLETGFREPHQPPTHPLIGTQSAMAPPSCDPFPPDLVGVIAKIEK